MIKVIKQSNKKDKFLSKKDIERAFYNVDGVKEIKVLAKNKQDELEEKKFSSKEELENLGNIKSLTIRA